MLYRLLFSCILMLVSSGSLFAAELAPLPAAHTLRYRATTHPVEKRANYPSPGRCKQCVAECGRRLGGAFEFICETECAENCRK